MVVSQQASLRSACAPNCWLTWTARIMSSWLWAWVLISNSDSNSDSNGSYFFWIHYIPTTALKAYTDLPFQLPFEVNTTVARILQMKKMRLREVKEPGHRHTARSNWDCVQTQVAAPKTAPGFYKNKLNSANFWGLSSSENTSSSCASEGCCLP